MPTIKLDEEAISILTNYRWDGNIRQLKNIAEQLSVLEENRMIKKDVLIDYLPNLGDNYQRLFLKSLKSLNLIMSVRFYIKYYLI